MRKLSEICEQRQYFRILDIARLYCALLIIFIHMGFGNDLSIIPCLCGQGVPFFFLASGFFFSKKARQSESVKVTVIQYIKPIVLVYFVWILLWLPATVMEYRRLYPGSLATLITVLFRRVFLAGIAPYWYLLVLAEGLLILALTMHRNRSAAGAVLCVLGIILGVIYSYQAEYSRSGIIYRAFYTVFSWNNNVIMSGFPLLFLGSIMDRHENYIKKVPFGLLLFLYLASVAAAFLVYPKSKNLFCIPFGILQAILLFSMSITESAFRWRIPVWLGKNARNLSAVVFLTHTVFLTILGNVCHIWDSAARYVITVLCAVGLYLATRKLNWKVLNKLLLIK